MTFKHVIPDLIRNLYKHTLLYFVIFLIFPLAVFASAQTDFEYQYSKYREHFSEFSLYKKDYLSAQSLDNQQKALLSAKQTINTRDLTKSSFAAYLRDLISQNNLKYSILDPVNLQLVQSQQFFASEASKGQSVVTLSDLNAFEESYSKDYQKYESFLKIGIVAHKITKLKNFSSQQAKSLASLKLKLPESVSVRVTERLESLESNLLEIDNQIDSMASFLVSPEGMDNSESEIFFSAKVEQLSEIRELQLSWMEQLIDLDLNYGKI